MKKGVSESHCFVLTVQKEFMSIRGVFFLQDLHSATDISEQLSVRSVSQLCLVLSALDKLPR